MSRRQHSSRQRRRTTLSLPADALSEAERIARARKVNVSTVIGEALSEGLRLQTTAERSNEVLEAIRKHFWDFQIARWQSSTASFSNPLLGSRRWLIRLRGHSCSTRARKGRFSRTQFGHSVIERHTTHALTFQRSPQPLPHRLRLQ